MIVCPSCQRVRIKPGMRMRRVEGGRTLREETWAKLFDDDPSAEMADEGATQVVKIAATPELCPECAKRAPAGGDI